MNLCVFHLLYKTRVICVDHSFPPDDRLVVFVRRVSFNVLVDQNSQC